MKTHGPLIRAPLRLIRLCVIAFTLATSLAKPPGVLEIGNHVELFVDSYLIERLQGLRMELRPPRQEETVLQFNESWEVPFAGALSVVKDGGIYRMYYRGVPQNAAGDYDRTAAVTCMAESDDGVHWRKPNLGLVEFKGSRQNNIVARLPLSSINFMVYLDARPGVPPSERYKAIGGKKDWGLLRWVSADGIQWRPFSTEPLFVGYALDTLNVLTWVPADECYAIYLRTWTEGGTPDRPAFAGKRTISRSISKDFITWTQPQPVDFGGAPVEEIYTNATQPYFRAPHLLISLPFRYLPERQVLSDERLRELQVHSTQRKGVSDVIFMTSRGGERFDRTFLESFVRPGPTPGAWVARSNVPAVGVVPTGPREMSFYITKNHTMPDYHVVRYSLRLDGFSSIRAPYERGELITKVLRVAGKRLVLNFETSAAGEILVEVQDADGIAISGYELHQAIPLIGDEIGAAVAWRSGRSLAPLNGRPVKFRIAMKDADLYSLQMD
jgi:hypothetical protein